jgi:hypothetical protein
MFRTEDIYTKNGSSRFLWNVSMVQSWCLRLTGTTRKATNVGIHL